ncbi:hypothetical protein [Chryseobacterium sp. Leaf180]|uniref:hypothetical protein n=1 Tax=Chryseobacterium sp. Leaf180 TaxID=1736289 RepID=UPI001039966C|nr:hypothetical protein [Chryseobacterium sp. Leaf180]
MTKQEYTQFKNFLLSKNLQVKDTVFIKYDFDKETCWNGLDSEGKKYINIIVKQFQEHVSNFNSLYPTAVAYNFRQPGKNFNKLKLWDETIIVDDTELLKKLIFKNKATCGTSAIILGDGSYLLYEYDPHFELLSLHHNYDGKKF